LDWLENFYPQKIEELQEELEELKLKPLLTPKQKKQLQQKIESLENQAKSYDDLIKNTKGEERDKLIDKREKLLRQAEELRHELEREDEIKFLEEKIERLKDKFITVVKEKELRKLKLVKRKPIGTTYYLDFDGATGTLTGTWTFTNGSTTVSGTGGSATTELAVGNYVRVSNGTQWYKVTSITDDNTFEITPAFQQDTITDAENATKYNNYDGTSPSTPFVHLNQFTTDTTRTAGDVLKVRANQTHLYKNINIVFDEDGTADNLIIIKGCDSSDDPWGDGSDVKPIIDFGGTDYKMYFSSDFYWKLQNLDLKGGGGSSDEVVYFSYDMKYWEAENCIFRENSDQGIYVSDPGGIYYFKNCSFYSNYYRGVYIYTRSVYSGRFFFENCNFDGGDSTTDYGIYVDSYSLQTLYLKNCQFGQTTAHDISDIRIVRYTGNINAQNCKFNKLDPNDFQHREVVFRSEDHNQVKGDNKAWYQEGTIEKETTIVRSGGADSSAKMSPTSNCNKKYPLTLSGWPKQGLDGDFKLWVPAQQTTITIYMRTFGYTTLPTADELYIEASYLDEPSGGHRATVKSTNTVSANDEWTPFSVTFTPAQEGWVYVTVYLKKYEANAGVYVDIKPIVS